MQISHKTLGVAEPKFTKFVAVANFLSAMLMQQSALRSVHPLSNQRGDILKKQSSPVTLVKHKPAEGITMPDGLIIN